jgi:hypothetical protein
MIGKFGKCSGMEYDHWSDMVIKSQTIVEYRRSLHSQAGPEGYGTMGLQLSGDQRIYFDAQVKEEMAVSGGKSIALDIHVFGQAPSEL